MNGHVLTVTLNPAVDKIVKVKNFSIGRDVRAESVTLSAGGKGINVSRALKHFGIKSVATGFLAGTTGHLIKAELKKENLHGNFLDVAGETRTNLTIIDTATHRITRVLEPGPKLSQDDFKRFRKSFLRLLSGCRWVVFSGSAAPGLPKNIFAELITIAKLKNIKTALDTSGQPLKFGLHAIPFLIKPNKDEAESVIGSRLTSFAKIKKAVRHFHNKSIKTVLISLGEKGAVGSDGKTLWFAAPPHFKPKTNVGCGDSLLGGFIAGHMRGNDFKECLRFAVACGSMNALSDKPGRVKKEIIEKLLKQISVTRL